MSWQLSFRIALVLIMISGSAAAPASAGRATGFIDAWTGAQTRGDEQDALAEPVAFIESLAPVPGRGVLALAATGVGHWRVQNRAGEPFTAANATELGRAFGTLAPEAQGDMSRLALYLDAGSLFLDGVGLEALPREAQLHVILDGRPHRVLAERVAGGHRPVVEIATGLLLEIAERDLFEEARWQLSRRLERAGIRTLALQPGGPTAVRRTPSVDATVRLAEVDRIDPGHMATGLSALSGQLAMVSGRLRDQRLVFKPETGPEASLELSTIERAAADADLNILVLDASSPRQPGSRNWLWQKVQLGNVAAAAEHTSLGGFLAALAGHDQLIVRARRVTDGRAALEIVPARETWQTGGGPLGSFTEIVTGTWSDLVSETAGQVEISALRASFVSRMRQTELDRRWLAGVPSWLQAVAAFIALAAGIGLPVAWSWWRGLWPAEDRGEYGSTGAYLMAGAVRYGAFLVLFLPLMALPAVVIRMGKLARTSTPMRSKGAETAV